MLLRLKVQGFKNLLDVESWFGPFTCVTGPNAAGKSNLFDAIRFLSLLTEHPIMEAAKRIRESKGRSPEPESLFTAIGSFRADEMRFTCDLLVNPDGRDDLGVSARASITTLRYTVAFRLNEQDAPRRLELVDEELRPIPLSEAGLLLGRWASKPFSQSAAKGRRAAPFISTEKQGDTRQVRIHQEGHGGRLVPAPQTSRTILGASASADYPTLLAAHREMQSWRTLMLEPSAMRAPSLYSDERAIDSRGANLPATIARLQRVENRPGAVAAELTNRLAELIPDVRSLRIRDDENTETLTLEAQGRDGAFHPARSLSDGTLRFLVLATLGLDPETRGTICLEEPENGVHPDRVEAMVKLLQDIAVDARHAIGEDNPLRQVLVNTHSGEVLRWVLPRDLIYIEEMTAVRGQSEGQVAAVRVPPGTWRTDLHREHGAHADLPPGLLRPYLAEETDEWMEQASLPFAAVAE